MGQTLLGTLIGLTLASSDLTCEIEIRHAAVTENTWEIRPETDENRVRIRQGAAAKLTQQAGKPGEVGPIEKKQRGFCCTGSPEASRCSKATLNYRA